jgi:tetratricopeptide (TPR) repeat protein
MPAFENCRRSLISCIQNSATTGNIELAKNYVVRLQRVDEINLHCNPWACHPCGTDDAHENNRYAAELQGFGVANEIVTIFLNRALECLQKKEQITTPNLFFSGTGAKQDAINRAGSYAEALADNASVWMKIGEKERAESLFKKAYDLEVNLVNYPAPWGGVIHLAELKERSKKALE